MLRMHPPAAAGGTDCIKASAKNDMRVFNRLLLPVLLLAALLIPTVAQNSSDFSNFRQRRRPTSTNSPAGTSFGEYTFVRTIYDSPSRGRRGYGYGGGTWTTDYPEADNNFIVGLREWAGTNLKIAPRPEALEILDDRIYDYPILYVVEPGFMELSPQPPARLREYLMRGGFFFIDDFWASMSGRMFRNSSTRSCRSMRSRIYH